PQGEIDLEGCRRLGIPLVRRITGGRAVLHGEDWTYSVTAPIADPLFGDTIHQTYRSIAQVFVRLFEGLGFATELKAHTPRQRVRLASPICFATPSAFELMIDGKKLVGSAQRRRPTTFLQHGSIPLRPQPKTLAALFTGADAGGLAEAMTDLESLGVWNTMAPGEFPQALVRAFEAEWGVGFDPWEPDGEVMGRVLRLAPAYVWPPVAG
ncbi:MAG: hypothetical protein OEW12_05225, partial [Deltaproteobacteria bacterium]|nr:hypothetical protein [Deltaproteobacteria bacterium]